SNEERREHRLQPPAPISRHPERGLPVRSHVFGLGMPEVAPNAFGSRRRWPPRFARLDPNRRPPRLLHRPYPLLVEVELHPLAMLHPVDLDHETGRPPVLW